MTQPESRLSTKIISALRAEGCFAFKIHGSEMMMAGLPDIMVCVDGLFLGLETKMPAKRANTSPRQRLVHQMIHNARGQVEVVCSVQEALDIVKALRAGSLS